MCMAQYDFFCDTFSRYTSKVENYSKKCPFLSFRAVNHIFSPLTVLLLHKKVAVSYMHILVTIFFGPQFDFARKMLKIPIFAFFYTFSSNNGMKILVCLINCIKTCYFMRDSISAWPKK